MNLDYLLILLNEIDNVNQPEKRSLENYLERLVENILKLQYWELEKGRDYIYWQSVVFNSRNFIRRLIKHNPSLRKYLEQVYPEIYQNAVMLWNFEFYIPENALIELEQILDKSYYG